MVLFAATSVGRVNDSFGGFVPSSKWTRRDFLETSLKTGAVVAAVPTALQSQDSIVTEAVATTGPNIAGAVPITLRINGKERQLRVDLTPRGHALREDALRIPPSVVAKLGMSLGDLEELRNGLTAINEAARRAGVNPLPAPAKGSV